MKNCTLSFCPNFFLGVTIHVGESGKDFGAQSQWKNFQGRPRRTKIQTSESNIIPIPVPGHSQEWRPLIPFPELWEWIFSFPSRSRILGMDFFHSLPVPEFWEWDFFIPFPFPKFGNGFFYSLPVPEFREWAFSIPFPFPNFGNGLFQFPSRSRTLKSHSRSPLGPTFC